VSEREPPKATGKTDAQAPTSFEDAIKRLSEIVKRLEEGELSLEDSLAAFERGIALARDAQQRLDAAEARVDELIGVDDRGNPVTRPVADAAARGARATPEPQRPRTDERAAPAKKLPVDDDDLPF
jgi:exodeoxyribonuclease VII small subunit